MKTVNRYTRANNNGKQITCPKCKQSSKVYHFSFIALTCLNCQQSINKYDWLLT